MGDPVSADARQALERIAALRSRWEDAATSGGWDTTDSFWTAVGIADAALAVPAPTDTLTEALDAQRRILMWATPVGKDYDVDTAFTEIRRIARESIAALRVASAQEGEPA